MTDDTEGMNVRYTVACLLLLAASCSAPVSDEATQRIREQSEIWSRNHNEPAFTPQQLNEIMTDPANSAAIREWRETRSYYALLEIVEGIIEPEIGRMRRQDVEALLGKGDPDYPNSNGRMLHYGGERRIPYASHVLIIFDDKDVTQGTEWVSE